MLIIKHTIDDLLYRDAITTGQNWARFLTRHVSDLEHIAEGEKPSAKSVVFFEQAQQVGNVFLYKVFDRDGNLRLVSDRLEIAQTDSLNLGEHNAAAARVIAMGQELVNINEGTPPGRPAFYAEAYIPVIVNGRRIAVVEAYVDQTEKRAQFHATFPFAAISIALLMAFAFGLPAFAWYRRTQEKARAEEHIRFLGHHDLMTQLPNRKHLIESLALALAALPANGTALALHCIDLDRLKDVNNSLGRETGDCLVRRVAERLRVVVPPNDLVARLSSDTFAVLQTKVTSVGAAEDLAQRIKNEIAKPHVINGKEVSVCASIGVTLAPAHGNDVKRLIKCAELALDKAKKSGRDCIRFFTPEMAARLDERLEIEQSIRDAIANESFELHFQPLLNLRSGRLTGFEALLRMSGRDGDFIPPAVFIPLAEEMGLIDAIGIWVIRQACRTAVQWPPHLTVAVNLSPAQFLAGKVASVVADALAEFGLDPHRLELEITENMLLSDADAVLAELGRLKAMGVKIAMDDFGTGYSSLRYLWRFPFDKLKIDAAFMRGLDGRDRNVEQIVRTIVALGRSLDLTVTAEGVENAHQLAFLREIDCDQVQGYLYGRPMPATDLAATILADYWRSLPVELAPPAAEAHARTIAHAR